MINNHCYRVKKHTMKTLTAGSTSKFQLKEDLTRLVNMSKWTVRVALTSMVAKWSTVLIDLENSKKTFSYIHPGFL